ncbi:MAG TPA: DinB family protein, partial [Thermomicrobiaceae bacterium]|nr:DinB family protein [Thermomicrobiaceae bacterium]
MAMTDQAVPLSTFYKGWGTYQRMFSDMLAPLSAEQLALPAAPHEWTIGMVAQHVIANRVWWFQVWMDEGDAALAPIAHWDPADPVEQPPLTAVELVEGLNATWAMIQDALDRWTAADLGHVFQLPAAVREEEREFYTPVSRQWIIWHVLEHEIHHGGELSLALGA